MYKHLNSKINLIELIFHYHNIIGKNFKLIAIRFEKIDIKTN